MKQYVVIFTADNARVLKGVRVEDYRGRPDVLINPELPAGIPPHQWKIVDGKIGVKAAHTEKNVIPKYIPLYVKTAAAAFVLGLVLGVLLG